MTCISSFLINNQEMAINVNSFKEVVSIQNLVSEESFLYRGDSCRLINLPNVNSVNFKYIVVFEISGNTLGLKIDQVGNIYKQDLENIKDQDLFINSFLNKKNQEVKVLNLNYIKSFFNLKDKVKKEQIKSEIPEKTIRFTLSNQSYAFDLHDVSEIVNIENVEKPIFQSPYLVGQIEIRKEKVPLINFSKLSGTANCISLNKAIVVRKGSERIALLVDSVDAISSYLKSTKAQHLESQIFDSKILINNNEHLLVNKDSVFTSDILQICNLFSVFFKDQQKNKITQISHKKTYITFLLDEMYAIEIDKVSEVLYYPKEVVSNPSGRFDSVVSLRDLSLPVINTHKHLSLPKFNEEALIVLEDKGERFSFSVQSLHGIMSFGDEEQFEIPSPIYCVKGKPFHIKKAVRVNPLNGSGKVDMFLINEDSFKEM